MIKIKTLMKVIPFLVMGMVVLNSCEGELDDLGSQLVDGGASEGVDQMYGIVAYNINNNDTNFQIALFNWQKYTNFGALLQRTK